MTVELVGVSEHSSEGKAWWKPDGTALREAPYERVGAQARGGANRQTREVAVRVSGAPGTFGRVHLTMPGTSTSSSSWVADDARKGDGPDGVSILSATACSMARELRHVTVRVGVETGAWETIASSNGRGASAQGGAIGVTLGPAITSEDGDMIMTASDDMPHDADLARRIVAVGHDGQVHTAGKRQGYGAGKVYQTTVRFGDIKLNQVKEFLFQTRPFEWVEFGNVSLEAGRRTDVAVVDGRAWRRVLIPDADEKGAGVILDLASGQMLGVPDEVREAEATAYFDRLGQGDLWADRVLGTLRGGTVQLIVDGEPVATRAVRVGDLGDARDRANPREKAVAYPDLPIPCEVLITTAEGRQFEMRVLAKQDDGGIEVAYRAAGSRGVGDGAGGRFSEDEQAIRMLISGLITAVVQGDEAAVSAKLKGGKYVDRVANFVESMTDSIAIGARPAHIESVRVHGHRALAVTEFFEVSEHGDKRTVCMVYGLSRIDEGWAIDDVDFEDAAGLERELRRFGGGDAEMAREVVGRVVRRVFIPDADDSKDMPTVLDLSSGMMFEVPDDVRDERVYFDKLGQGDLWYDMALGTLRGATAELIVDGQVDESWGHVAQRGNSSIYTLPDGPCELRVTTGDGRVFDVGVLGKRNGGIEIEYTGPRGGVVEGDIEAAMAYYESCERYMRVATAAMREGDAEAALEALRRTMSGWSDFVAAGRGTEVAMTPQYNATYLGVLEGACRALEEGDGAKALERLKLTPTYPGVPVEEIFARVRVERQRRLTQDIPKARVIVTSILMTLDGIKTAIELESAAGQNAAESLTKTLLSQREGLLAAVAGTDVEPVAALMFDQARSLTHRVGSKDETGVAQSIVYTTVRRLAEEIDAMLEAEGQGASSSSGGEAARSELVAARLAALRRREQELSITKGPSHPERAYLRKQIADLEQLAHQGDVRAVEGAGGVDTAAVVREVHPIVGTWRMRDGDRAAMVTFRGDGTAVFSGNVSEGPEREIEYGTYVVRGRTLTIEHGGDEKENEIEVTGDTLRLVDDDGVHVLQRVGVDEAVGSVGEVIDLEGTERELGSELPLPRPRPVVRVTAPVVAEEAAARRVGPGHRVLDGADPPQALVVRREVWLAGEDARGAGPILDLASGEMIVVEQEFENNAAVMDHSYRLGKGDLSYHAKERGLVTMRGRGFSRWWTVRWVRRGRSSGARGV